MNENRLMCINYLQNYIATIVSRKIIMIIVQLLIKSDRMKLVAYTLLPTFALAEAYLFRTILFSPGEFRITGKTNK